MVQQYRNTERKASVYATERPCISEESNLAPRRRLVDYTQYRRDGTTSRRKENISKAVTESPRQALVMGLPTCHALEASLSNKILANATIEDDEEPKTDRINFYLKVAPKNQRKLSRISTSTDSG